MKRAAFVAFSAACAAPMLAAAQDRELVTIRSLTPREYRSEGFVLSVPQTVRIEAVGAEPAPERRRRDSRENEWWGPEEERQVWPAACWILNARTREVVWDIRTARTERSDDGLHRFDGALTLPAGIYEAHYGSFAATWYTPEGSSLRSIIRGLARGSRPSRYGGPYVDDGTFREFRLVVKGEGRPASVQDLEEALKLSTSGAFATLRPATPDSSAEQGFELTQPAVVEVLAGGELRADDEFDYAWIMNATTRQRVWSMRYDQSQPAGGSVKNRMTRDTLRLEAGRYVAYFVADDTHHPGEWNAIPPLDPGRWGLTLRLTNGARGIVRPYVWEPVPAGQTIVSLTGVGDDEMRSEGFTLRKPLEVRVYAIGEGTGGDPMHDYAWIVNARTRQRVWTMEYEATEHAGGADKNRLFDGVLQLEPGDYIVHYRSDGSHSAKEWNSSRPTDSRYWGVSVFPSSGKLDRTVVGPYDRNAGRGPLVAELVHMGDNERADVRFKLDRETAVQIQALGEGSGGDMYDYAWIEVANTGRVVWEMTYRTSEPAGGAEKNRVFDGTIRLPAGSYVLRYESDGSHSYHDWNADPPDDPEAWGVTVRRATDSRAPDRTRP